MFFYPEYDAQGRRELSAMDSPMRMHIYVQRLHAGEEMTSGTPGLESAALLLRGKVEFRWGGNTVTGERRDPFEKKPYALHCPQNMRYGIYACTDAEVLIEETDNTADFEPHFYDPSEILYQEFGKGQWGGTGHRIVSTVFDYDNAPYSNLVLGEVFTQPGRWSSYPPHHHPQPEVYYYCFDKPQGFGACYLGNDVYKSTDGSCAWIEPGLSHQQAAAPGYEMYYVWMIRHNDGDPWYKATRIVDAEHEWLTRE